MPLVNRPYEIDVLLATYNGEKYLGDFLESLAAQEGVNINLKVSDDGSQDSTLDVISSFASRFHSFELLQGPRKGPASNFMELIKLSTSNFAALADQDDIWLPNHLLDSISRLTRMNQVPGLSFSSVIEFDTKNPQEEAIWPKRFPRKDVREILTENLARGCTIVLNKSALEIINKSRPRRIVMHDWWIFLTIFCVGEITWGNAPEIRYRLHDSNTVGVPSSQRERLGRWRKSFTSGSWQIYDQACEVLYCYGQYMNDEKRIELQTWCNQAGSRNLRDKFALASYSGRYRTRILDEIAVRVTLLTLTLRKMRKRPPI